MYEYACYTVPTCLLTCDVLHAVLTMRPHDIELYDCEIGYGTYKDRCFIC